MKRFALLFAMFLMASALMFAGIADGTWTAQGTAPVTTLVLTSTGGFIYGSADGVQISDGRVTGNSIAFNVVKNGTAYSLKGMITGTTLNLHQTVTATGAQHTSGNLVKSN